MILSESDIFYIFESSHFEIVEHSCFGFMTRLVEKIDKDQRYVDLCLLHGPGNLGCVRINHVVGCVYVMTSVKEFGGWER